MQTCLICRKHFNFLIPVGEIVICKDCEKRLEDNLNLIIEMKSKRIISD